MKCFKKVNLIISFLIFFIEIASKLEKFNLIFSSFNLFAPLPFAATDERKQNKYHNIVLNNKPRLLILGFG